MSDAGRIFRHFSEAQRFPEGRLPAGVQRAGQEKPTASRFKVNLVSAGWKPAPGKTSMNERYPGA